MNANRFKKRNPIAWISVPAWTPAWCCGWVLASVIAPVSADTPERNLAINAAEPASSVNADWTRFHGTSGLGAVAGGTLHTTWTPNDYAWTASLGGTDVGSPVTNDSMIFLLDSTQTVPAAETSTAQTNDENAPTGSIDLVALDLATGKELWRRPHPTVSTKRHNRNSPASTTPTVDRGRVFFACGDVTGASLYAYSIEGERLWHRALGPWAGVHGFGTSPVVIDSQLILFNSQQVDELESWQTAGESRMISFDPATGETLWSTPLKTTRPCYGVPSVFEPAPTDADPSDADSEKRWGPQLIAANKGNGLFGLDLASGELLWSLDVFDKRCCSSPLVIGDIAVGSSGSGGGGNVLSAVRIPKQPGDAPEEVFRVTSGAPYVPTPAVKGDLMFTISDSGIASCYDTAEGGMKKWSQRIGGNFSASPIVIGNQLLMISLDGTAHVTSASDRRSPISEFDLGGKVGATPAIAAGRLILRVGDKLHCLPINP